jgi:hypothetical protein
MAVSDLIYLAICLQKLTATIFAPVKIAHSVLSWLKLYLVCGAEGRWIEPVCPRQSFCNRAFMFVAFRVGPESSALLPGDNSPKRHQNQRSSPSPTGERLYRRHQNP